MLFKYRAIAQLWLAGSFFPLGELVQAQFCISIALRFTQLNRNLGVHLKSPIHELTKVAAAFPMKWSWNEPLKTIDFELSMAVNYMFKVDPCIWLKKHKAGLCILLLPN